MVQRRNRTARSVWSASSLLALSDGFRRTQSGSKLRALQTLRALVHPPEPSQLLSILEDLQRRECFFSAFLLESLHLCVKSGSGWPLSVVAPSRLVRVSALGFRISRPASCVNLWLIGESGMKHAA